MSGTSQSYLGTNQWLTSGGSLVSPSGVFSALMQGDGNFVVYAGDSVTSPWSIGGPSRPAPFFIIMQDDGNLVAYEGDGPNDKQGSYWSSNSVGAAKGDYCLALQDDGQLMIFSSATPPAPPTGAIWTSGRSDPVVAVQNGVLAYDLTGVKPTIVPPPQRGGRERSHNPLDTEQSASLAIGADVAETSGWNSTVGGSVSVDVSGNVGIPLVANGSVSVAVSANYSYQWNGSTSRSTNFTATANLKVPPHKTYWVQMQVSRAQLSCPYTLAGMIVLQSGAKFQGTINGIYTGLNGDVVDINYGEDGSDKVIGKSEFSNLGRS
jgi:Clostridium epsilon toxin ETX/Bacillus mosquitocidal toxin MTX2